MAYNYLREAESIRNYSGCSFDSSSAYEVDWDLNGDVDGWDSYSLVHTYGVWDSVLFGTSYGGNCYISRTAYFSPVAAEDYYFLRIQMKLSATRDGSHITQGKVQWIKDGDILWDDDKSAEFDVVADDKWRYYNINLGPEQWWQGDIRNLRIFPFLSTRAGDRFFIRSISIISPSAFSCTNPTCSFYSSYEHPCQGVGTLGYCLGTSIGTVDIVEDVNDELIVNIDDYGDQYITLGDGSGLTVQEIAREIERQLVKVDIGGYVNASAERDADRIKINSGTAADDSSVVVKHSQLAEDLGFFSGVTDISTKATGTDPATGFEHAASYRLKGAELNKLVNSDTTETAFYHDPSRYEVEAGRIDWQQAVTGLIEQDVDHDYTGEYYTVFDGEGTTVIDYTHPFNSDGRVTKVQLMGYPKEDEAAKMKIFRPKMNGELELVLEESFGIENVNYVYSVYIDTFEVDVDLRVRKGDLVGFYNMNLYLGNVIGEDPDALLFYIQGDATGTFSPGELQAYGSFGLNFYARSDRRQDLALISIDLGDRVNAKSLLFYGEELAEDFEYNVAICEDINWNINLFGGTHTHAVDYSLNPDLSYTATHQNVAYGASLLGDGISFSDGGLAGTSYGFSGSTGFYTSGGETYFYINGDAEWLNMSPGEDFGLPYWTGSVPTDFAHDPIQFKLTFPEDQTFSHTRIYFKERKNFYNFGWAYFVGEYQYVGNYPQDSRYQYIPAYTAVSIDGNRWTPETAPEDFADYIFSNPTDASWSTGETVGDRTYLDPDTQVGGLSLLWNVLEHEFEPVTTKSIVFYTDWHDSTKIYEMEVFATVANEPSLLDDVYVQHSREGDYWNTSVFEDIIIDGQEVTAALIQDNPRYITLEIRSSSVVRYNEFELLLEEDNVYVGDTRCQDELQMTTTRRGAPRPSQYIDIWNEFEVPATLTVDIPTEDDVDRVVLWSKLNSEDDVTNPDIGPGGYVYKNPDYEFKNDDYQVAINNQCWALKNLADQKYFYYQYHNFGWLDWGLYSIGDNIEVAHPNKRQSGFSFTPTSATYFKFMPKNFAIYGVSEMLVSYDGDDIEFTGYREGSIDPTTPLTNSETTLTDTNPTTGDFNVGDNYTVIDSFSGASIDTNNWRISNSQYLEVTGGELKTTFDAANQTCYVDSFGKWMLPYDRHWKLWINFEMDNWAAPTGSDHNIIRFQAYDVQNSGYYIYIDRRINNSEDLLYYYHQRPSGGGGSSVGAVSEGFDSDFTSLRFLMYHYTNDNMQVRFYTPTYDHYWNRTGFTTTDVGWWFRIYFHTSAQAVTIPNFRVSLVYEEMPDSEGVLGASFPVHTAVDSFRVLHNDTATENGPVVYQSIEGDPNTTFNVADEWSVDVYVSYDNVTYSYWDTASVIFNNYNIEIETYLTTDLGQRLALDYIRTYGPSATDYDIANNTRYYNDETSDVNDIEPEAPGDYPTTFSDDFTGINGDPPDSSSWTIGGSPYINNDKLRMDATGNSESAWTAFWVSGNFDVEVGFDSLVAPSQIAYSCELRAQAADGHFVNIRRAFDGVQVYKSQSYDGTTHTLATTSLSDTAGKFRIMRDGTGIKTYYDNGGWIEHATDTFGVLGSDDVRFILYLSSWGGNPTIQVNFDNFSVSYIETVLGEGTGSIDDCRWPVIVIPEGEAIGKIGIYPNSEYSIAPGGGYNCEWEDIGNILTDYAYKTNVALNASISASSEFGAFRSGFVIDGVKPDGEVEKVWGSSDTTPYLNIDLQAEYDIDELKCYWGYYTGDTQWLVTDYEFWTALSDTVDYFSGADGDAPDPDKWEIALQAEIENNSLKVWSNTADDGFVNSDFLLGGDFDIRVTYSGTFPDLHAYSTILRVFDPSNLPEINDDFTGTNNDPPDTSKWSFFEEYSPDNMYIWNNKLRVDNSDGTRLLQNIGILTGDFTVDVDFNIIVNQNVEGWGAGINVYSLTDPTTEYVIADRGVSYLPSGQPHYRMYSNGSDKARENATTTSGTLRLVREGNLFTMYYKDATTGGVFDEVDEDFGSFTHSTIGDSVYVALKTAHWGSNPDTIVDFDNFTVDGPYAVGTANQSIQIRRGYDNFTHEYLSEYYDGAWNTLSSATTTDTSGALRLMRTGSVIYCYYWDDGWISMGTSTLLGVVDVQVKLMQKRWDNDPETVGYFENFFAYDTKILDITANTDYNAVHSLSDAVTCRNVLVQILGYDAGSMIVETGDGTFETFAGSMCREIELLETKGEYFISSEDYPIVAVDLGYKFIITAHDVTTPYPDYPDSLWDNSNSKFRYSDSFLDDPQKVEFTALGASLPRDAKWILANDTDFISSGVTTYKTDFSEYTLYEEPDDWYAHYPPGGYTWEITDAETNPLPSSDSVMLAAVGADDYRFVWETVPLAADVEILGLVLTPSEGRSDSPAIIGRGSRTWDLGDQQGFWADVGPNPDDVELFRYIPGDYYNNQWSVSAGVDGESWYWIRMRLEGTTQYLKAWKYGNAEPGSWDGTDTVSDLTESGWVGVYHATNAFTAYWAWFSVGIGGSSAPHPDDPDIDEIEQAVTGGVNFLDNITVSSDEKYRITRFPWWWQSTQSTLTDNYTYIRPDSAASVQIDYTGGVTTSGIDEIIFIEGTNFGTDERFSEMDYLSFWLYVPDPTKLANYGEVTFGDYDEPRYSSWDISSIVSGFTTGWNEVEIKFRDAGTKINVQGDPTYSADWTDLNNYEDLELKSFRLMLRGKGDPFTIYLDDIRLERNTFHDDVKFGKGLYLAHSEYAVWPLSEFDPHKGTIEFWMRPDFNFYGTDSFFRTRSRTIFAFTNVANDIFGLFFRKGSGPALVVGNSEGMVTEYATPSVNTAFVNNDVVHVGFLWSNDGTAIHSSGITAAIFINGWWIAFSKETWEIRDKKSTRLIIGGAVPQAPALQDPTSAWASIDNLKVYNYCKKDFLDKEIEDPEFSELLSPNEFIEISSDNVMFYNRDSSALPLTFEQVPVDESRRIWVRTNIPISLTGKEKRTADLQIEWLRSF